MADGSGGEVLPRESLPELAEAPQPENAASQELEDVQRKMSEKEARLLQLQSEVLKMKEGLTEVVGSRRAVAEVWTQVLATRSRVNLMRQLYEANKSAVRKEYEEVKHLQRSNGRREERLKRVRAKNFQKREEDIEVEYAESCARARQVAVELQSRRKEFVSQAFSAIFPIEVEPLSLQDAGEEDYMESSPIDCDLLMEVDGGWMLSGMHKLPAPHICIVTASVPSDGDYSLYLKAAKERRKAYAETAQRGVSPPLQSSEVWDPRQDPYFTVPAAMTFTAQFVELIADVLDHPLPYPLPRHTAISDYGSLDRKKKHFVDSVAKLDDNILYLCFSQYEKQVTKAGHGGLGTRLSNVPLSALTPGHTLKNLLTLVTHTQLGRSGAFECHPELTRFRGTGIAALGQDTDSLPPSISYTNNQLLHGYQGDSNTSESEEEGEGGEGEAQALNASADTDEWEPMGPLLPGGGEEMGHPPNFHMSAELDSHRERMRRLDYDSTYLDYLALGVSGASDRSVQLSATDSVRLLGSIKEKGETEGGERGSRRGLLGTLSNLWSSTFSRPKT